MTKSLKVLLTGKNRGSVNVLAPIARELARRGHQTTLYATGNEAEAAGFGDLTYQRIQPVHYEPLIEGHDVVLTGLSGYTTPDGAFVYAATKAGIPSVAVQDRNGLYKQRLGQNPNHFPTYIAVMNDECIATARKEMKEFGDEVAQRCRVIGWAAFDGYAEKKNTYTNDKRNTLLSSLEINAEELVSVHFTQNIHPNTKYMKPVARPYDRKVRDFVYELGVTQFTFETASDLGLKLTVKPHPGEEYNYDYTKELAHRHGFRFIPANACSSQDLMLAAYSITAGMSTSLTESTLLDRNTGAIIPNLDIPRMTYRDHAAFPPLELKAIPSVSSWDGISSLLQIVTSTKDKIVQKLSQDRTKFSVDGKASARCVDLIEEIGK